MGFINWTCVAMCNYGIYWYVGVCPRVPGSPATILPQTVRYNERVVAVMVPTHRYAPSSCVGFFTHSFFIEMPSLPRTPARAPYNAPPTTYPSTRPLQRTPYNVPQHAPPSVCYYIRWCINTTEMDISFHPDYKIYYSFEDNYVHLLM